MSNKIGVIPILSILLATFIIISSQSSEVYANTNSSLPKSSDIIVPDFGSNGSFILSINPQNGSQAKITTGGVQTAPGAITVDDKGIIYILQMERDSGAIQIFKFDPSTGIQDIVSSGGFLGINYMSELPNIYGITTDSSGNILVTDASGKIIKIDSITGNQSIIFSDTKLVGAFDIEIANNGDYIVSTWGGWASDFSSSAIIRISPITGSISVVSSNGTLTDGGGRIEIDSSGNIIFMGRNFVQINPVTGVQKILSSVATGSDFVIDQNGDFITTRGGFGMAHESKIMRVNHITGEQELISTDGFLHDPLFIGIYPTISQDLTHEQDPITIPIIEEKITICHIPPGNENNPQTLLISKNAWTSHQQHGDHIGECLNPVPESKPVSKTPDFIDPKKGAQYYLDRYNNEKSYKDWFDSNFPDYTIKEAIELVIPGSFSEPEPKPLINNCFEMSIKLPVSAGEEFGKYGDTNEANNFQRLKKCVLNSDKPVELLKTIRNDLMVRYDIAHDNLLNVQRWTSDGIETLQYRIYGTEFKAYNDIRRIIDEIIQMNKGGMSVSTAFSKFDYLTEHVELSPTISEPINIQVPILKPNQEITVITSKNSYNIGDTVIISGKVASVIDDTPVTLQVFHEGNLADIAQITVAQDGKFTHTMLVEGPLWVNNERYSITASYGANYMTETHFDIGTPKIIPKTPYVELSTDDSSYNKGDVIVISGQVDNSQDSKVALTISDPRNISVYQNNLYLKSDGSFSEMIIAGDGNQWIDGSYDVKALTQGNSKTISFTFKDSTASETVSTSQVTPSVETPISQIDVKNTDKLDQLIEENKKLREEVERQGQKINDIDEQVDYLGKILESIQGFFKGIFG